jgi:exonuclease SbcC
MLSDLAKLRAQIEQIQNIGPETVCDRCHRPFGDDLPKIREHLDSELRQLVVRLETADHEISAIQTVGGKMKAQLAEASAKAGRRYELSVKYDSLTGQLREIRKRREALSGDIARTEKQLAEAGEVEFDAARFEEATGQLKQLDSVKGRLDQLLGQLSRLPAVERSILEVSEKLATGQNKVAELTTALAETGFDQGRFDKLTEEFNSAQAEVEQQKTRLLEASKELDLELKEIELKDEQMSRFKEAEAELEECATGEFYGEKLGRLFADFRKQLIAGIRPRLAELTSTLFAEMTDGRYSMVELDPDYNLRIMDYGQFFGIDRFSGGEKDLANLCLRLAISQALTESAGLDRSFVILDEVFGSQDEERRDLIFHGLVNLKNQFQQVLLITHIDEIKDKVEMLVQVDRASGGWSEVRVNGQAV